ncbi:MAG: helix-turn-helix domain-containing protein [Promethearchaeota archaeon]
MLKVSQKTIRCWDAAGKIICSRTPGNHLRISMSEVVRLQAQRNI